MLLAKLIGICMLGLIASSSAPAASHSLRKGLPLASKRIIVSFNPNKNSHFVAPQHIALADAELVHEEHFELPDLHIYRASDNADLPLLAAALELHRSIAFAEPDYRYDLFQRGHIKGVTQPNDPLIQELYGLRLINATKAWEKSIGDRRVVVAITDTGAAVNHPDLAANIFVNPGESGKDALGRDKATNGRDDDANGYVDDLNGWNFMAKTNDPNDTVFHGTHVAGTIGAVGNNGIGITGVAWQTALLPLKFIDRMGGSLVDAIAAIQYAVAMKANVINASWGGPADSRALRKTIAAAGNAGVLFVAAAGNSGADSDSRPMYPAAFPLDNIISVAAVDAEGQLARFSNFGKRSVDVAAPGVDVLSCIPGNDYKKYSGTSMAAPHVSGIAALLKSMYPKRSMRDIRDLLIAGARQTSTLQGRILSGGLADFSSYLESDATPPATVEKLAPLPANYDSLGVSFSPSGDDGTEGSSRSYGLYIRKEGQPVSAEHLALMLHYPVIRQGSIDLRLGGLPMNTRLLARVVAFDNVLNPAPPSASIALATVAAEQRWFDDVEGDSWFDVQAPWRRTTGDSHSGAQSYRVSSEDATSGRAILTSTPIGISRNSGDRVVLSFMARQYGGFPTLHLHIAGDGGTFAQLLRISNDSEVWTRTTVDITKSLADSDRVTLRFSFEAPAKEPSGVSLDDFGLYIAK